MSRQEINNVPNNMVFNTTEEQTAPEYRVGCEMKAPMPGRPYSNFGVSVTVTDTDYGYARDMAVGSTLKEFHELEVMLATHTPEEIVEMYRGPEPNYDEQEPVS